METKNIMIVGVGGQGTLLTSKILGSVILQSGYDVKISEVHGMAQRGGSVVTFVRYGHMVYKPVVEEGEVDLLIAFECLEALRYAHYLKQDGIIILNNQRINPMPVTTGSVKYPTNIIETLKNKHHLLVIDAMSIAKELGNTKVFNIIVLGVAAKYLNFCLDVCCPIIENIVPVKTVDVNKKAFELGYYYERMDL